MLFAITTAAIFGAVSLGIIVRLKEPHVNLNDLFDEMDAKPAHPAAESWAAIPLKLASVDAAPADVFFTESLLALNRVGLRVPGGSPAHVHDESSSLVSVRPAQLKNPVQAL